MPSRMLYNFAECNATVSYLYEVVISLNTTVNELVTANSELVAVADEAAAEAAAECTHSSVAGWTPPMHIASVFIIVRMMQAPFFC